MTFSTLWVLCFVILCRVYFLLPPTKSKRAHQHPTRRRDETCHLAVFLGSGGHTSEALQLLSLIRFSKYTPRTYIISKGDKLSAERAAIFEAAKEESKDDRSFSILEIPRARKVHQSLLTAPGTTLISLISCLYHVCLQPAITGKPFADVLIVNGPGTCVMLCIGAFLSRMLCIPNPRTIYVESFARVKSISLSGRLLRPFVDRFIVQWPETLQDGGRGEYRGWLV